MITFIREAKDKTLLEAYESETKPDSQESCGKVRNTWNHIVMRGKKVSWERHQLPSRFWVREACKMYLRKMNELSGNWVTLKSVLAQRRNSWAKDALSGTLYLTHSNSQIPLDYFTLRVTATKIPVKSTPIALSNGGKARSFSHASAPLKRANLPLLSSWTCTSERAGTVQRRPLMVRRFMEK